jgi:DNA/RNA-binding domain of Phe-tRNA-synthetase-like protein
MLEVTEAFKAAYPGAAMGILAMRGAGNPAGHPEVAKRIGALESQLRARFADRNALRALPAMAAYEAYYKRFKKTYHVLLQLESVALKGKPVPRAGALVEAMFMAELESLLLTAGHDLAAIRGPLRLDVASGSERYIMLNGQEQELKPGDMMVADGEGVISCVVYGPDRRTRITPGTRDVLYAVYAPPGIPAEAVHRHLQGLQANVRLAAPAAQVETLKVYGAL